jgi:hypothetical protein
MSQEHPVNHTWVLWYHDPNSAYSNDSCDIVGSFKNVEDFWRFYYQLKPSQLQNGMFFLALEGYYPSWENNIDGGSWSFKIDKKEISHAWTKLSIHLISENFLKSNTTTADTTTVNTSNLYDEIICISISPKKTFSIFKVWIKDDSKKDLLIFRDDLPYLNQEEAVYRTHKDIYQKELERVKVKDELSEHN